MVLGTRRAVVVDAVAAAEGVAAVLRAAAAAAAVPTAAVIGATVMAHTMTMPTAVATVQSGYSLVLDGELASLSGPFLLYARLVGRT